MTQVANFTIGRESFPIPVKKFKELTLITDLEDGDSLIGVRNTGNLDGDGLIIYQDFRYNLASFVGGAGIIKEILSTSSGTYSNPELIGISTDILVVLNWQPIDVEFNPNTGVLDYSAYGGFVPGVLIVIYEGKSGLLGGGSVVNSDWIIIDSDVELSSSDKRIVAISSDNEVNIILPESPSDSINIEIKRIGYNDVNVTGNIDQENSTILLSDKSLFIFSWNKTLSTFILN